MTRPSKGAEARTDAILAHVKAGKLVTLAGSRGAYALEPGSQFECVNRTIVSSSLLIGDRHVVRGGHVRVPLDVADMRNLLGSTLLFSGSSQVYCSNWVDPWVAAGGKVYSADALLSMQVMWRPFGAGDPHPWLPCWKTVLEDGVVL